MSTSSDRASPRPVPAQARSRQRYEDICAAAIRVLRTGGMSACTMAAVAAEATMTPTSLYRYFPNVEALLASVAQMQLDQINDQLDRGLTGLTSVDDARAALLAGLDGYEQLFRSDGAMRAVWAGSLALPALAELNEADSRRNGALLEERLRPFRRTPLEPGRGLLTAHLVGSGVVLLLDLDEPEASAVRAELRAMVLRLLDE